MDFCDLLKLTGLPFVRGKIVGKPSQSLTQLRRSSENNGRQLSFVSVVSMIFEGRQHNIGALNVPTLVKKRLVRKCKGYQSIKYTRKFFFKSISQATAYRKRYVER